GGASGRAGGGRPGEEHLHEGGAPEAPRGRGRGGARGRRGRGDGRRHGRRSRRAVVVVVDGGRPAALDRVAVGQRRDRRRRRRGGEAAEVQRQGVGPGAERGGVGAGHLDVELLTG